MKIAQFVIANMGDGLEIIDPRTGATTGQLTLGETFEQIIWLFEIDRRSPYPMRPPHEWSPNSGSIAPVDGAEFLEAK